MRRTVPDHQRPRLPCGRNLPNPRNALITHDRCAVARILALVPVVGLVKARRGVVLGDSRGLAVVVVEERGVDVAPGSAASALAPIRAVRGLGGVATVCEPFAAVARIARWGCTGAVVHVFPKVPG